jgi:hypothetical protein
MEMEMQDWDEASLNEGDEIPITWETLPQLLGHGQGIVLSDDTY